MSIEDQKTSLPRTNKRPAAVGGRQVNTEYRQLDGEQVHCLTHVNRLDPFFMSLVSGDDHWMFVASNGALTCGRSHSDQALFPYLSSDKLLDLRESTGPKTILRVPRASGVCCWEPFSDRGHAFEIERHLYKNVLGSQITFEEINHSLGLAFLYRWNLSPKFGFVRTVELVNLEAASKYVTVLDGLQNIHPGGLQQDFQLRFGNLANAYKKSELLSPAKLGVYYMNSIPTDRAEPSEGLMANAVWSFGIEDPLILLSSRQLDAFREGRQLDYETDIRGQRGCYFTVHSATLGGRDVRSWGFVGDVALDSCDLENLQHTIELHPDPSLLLKSDVRSNDTDLWRFASQVDGLQRCNDQRRSDRHLSNAIFNMLRGGVPAQAYLISIEDFRQHVRARNRILEQTHLDLWQSLPANIELAQLIEHCRQRQDLDLMRIAAEYLPLTLSRRHGDPTRPWNHFKIQTRQRDGSRRIGYEGNWRDIFQNWEALAFSFPHLLPSMILRFVNASTGDGYNPYRINHHCIDWERPEPHDPWSNIGYWGDHQIVYLCKLLEQARATVPDQLNQLLHRELCVSTRLPYRIRDFAAILADPRQTIDYDFAEADAIQERIDQIGFDGQLTQTANGERLRVNLLEKLLVTALVKLGNFVPDAGIWMNTQRPEWNDAQNALAGNGASVVTTCHLHRYLNWLEQWCSELAVSSIPISVEVYELFESVIDIFGQNINAQPPGACDARRRFEQVTALQLASEAFRHRVYAGFTGVKRAVSLAEVAIGLKRCRGALAETIRNNRRPEGLYHSFNLLVLDAQTIEVESLDEMLEGQVAVLESGLLSATESCELLKALRQSRLYREDQDSYLLYPNRTLARFQEKNRIRIGQAEERQLLEKLDRADASAIVRRDHRGDYHFAGRLRNVADLRAAAQQWNAATHLPALLPEEVQRLELLWEKSFQHRRFIGRATTFFAYEGLGSIYWHMVSKLAYAVVQNCVAAFRSGDPRRGELLQHFREINEGIWLRKTAERYGAFPTDPYSHTPAHAGAQQPGMTGQVKEDLLVRFAELGIRYHCGQVSFAPQLLRNEEFLLEPALFQFWDQLHRVQALELPAHSLAFTLCQVPIVYQRSNASCGITIHWRNGDITQRPERELTIDESQSLFLRSGEIKSIEVQVSDHELQAVEIGNRE